MTWEIGLIEFADSLKEHPGVHVHVEFAMGQNGAGRRYNRNASLNSFTLTCYSEYVRLLEIDLHCITF